MSDEELTVFVASNGVTVRIDSRGHLLASQEETHFGVTGDFTHATATPDAGVEALREFFRDEEDKRLGRWRSPQHPEFIAYWNRVLGTLTVIWEPQGGSTKFTRDDVPPPGLGGLPAAVARAYFDTHYAPKPWHRAKPGEAWALTVDGTEYAWFVGDGVDLGRFIYIGGLSNISLDDPSITAGYRLYPESDS